MSTLIIAERMNRLAMPALLLGGIAVGASPLFVRLSEIGPSATACHRALWALPLLYAWMRLEARHAPMPRRVAAGTEWRQLVLCGLLFAGDLAFWHWAILYTTIANATLFANFSTLVVTIGAWLLFRERITGRFLAGMLTALAGAGLLVGSSLELGGRYVIGDGLGVVTAMFFGAYVLAMSRLRTVLPASTIMFWSTLVTCLGLLPVAVLSGESLLPETWRGLLILLLLGWLSHAGGQGLIAFALGHLPAALSSLVILIEPLAAAVFGWLLMGEALGPLQIAGGVAVLAGILIARRAGAAV